MNNYVFKSKEHPKPECFADADMAFWYRHLQSNHITESYFYGTPEKIYSFSTIMQEDLNCGFMHYHIPKQYHAYFSEKYPELAKPTNQIHYIHTSASHRKKGYGGELLTYILKDMTARGFRYVWLRSDIPPSFYFKRGFLTFTEALKKICPNFEDFMKDYEEKVEKREQLDRHFGELRLVYICEL